MEWIFFTIDEFINNSDNALIIRIHPAEITGTVKSRQKISNEIFSRYKTLPENIYIIDAESSISSYEVATIIDYSLVYGTKFAIELAVQGIPVLVSGDCWAKGKGFTIDITRKSQLKKFIENPNTIKFNKLKQTDRALRFARYLYFDRMIEIEDVILAKYFTQHKIMFKSFHQLRESKQLQNLINQILSRKKKITN